MMVFVRPRLLQLALVAVAAAAFSACSQSAPGSAGPGAVPSVTRSQAHSAGTAAQAKAMLKLVTNGHAAIGKVEIVGGVRRDVRSAIYDSIVLNRKGKFSSHIASEGFECCSVSEFGDGLVFTHSGARLNTVSAILQSWGCESGHWYSDDCLTTPGSNFEEPITANVYSVTTSPSGSPAPGALLATATADFYIPYRPSANNQKCFGSAYYTGAFFGPVDKKCDEGLSVRITFNFRRSNVTLPSEAIVTLAYNTSHAGYSPYGQDTPCYYSSGGCGYDGLNVSANGNGGFIGSNIDPNGVFVNFADTFFYCNGTGNGTGGLQLDTPCWTGYHPEIDVSST